MYEPFYHISIPVPSLTNLEQVAQILSKVGIISVYWRRTTRQVILELNNNWYIQPNEFVTVSLGHLLNVPDYMLICRGLFFFVTPGHGRSVNNEMTLEIYNCEWSDYASDHIHIQFDLEINDNLTSYEHQINYAYDELNSDMWTGLNDDDTATVSEVPPNDIDDYADMPGLVSLSELNTPQHAWYLATQRVHSYFTQYKS